MIQRIQTIFLLVVVAAMSTFIFSDLIIFTSETATTTISGWQIKSAEGNSIAFFILIPAVLAIATAVFSIFQFKNRLLQMKLGALNSLFMGLCIGLCYYYMSTYGSETTQMALTKSFYLPMVGLMFNLISNRSIRRDEKLVRDSNRLR